MNGTETVSAFQVERSQMLAEYYSKFREKFDQKESFGRILPYKWYNLPENYRVHLLLYIMMLDNFARELVNEINRFTQNVRRLKAWSSVIVAVSENEKLEIHHEFIENIGISALIAPYSLKSRFAYIAARLSHESNNIIRKDSEMAIFPESSNLYLNDIDPYCRNWKSFRKFKISVERIDGAAYRESTRDFHNAYAHRFPVRFNLGYTFNSTTEIDEYGNKSIAFKDEPPLDLNTMIVLLEEQLNACYLAFDCFQALICEQVKAVSKHAI